MSKTSKKEESKSENGNKSLKDRIRKQCRIAEIQVCVSCWMNTDLFHKYDFITEEYFHDDCWKTYFKIGKDIVVKEKKVALDEITVNLYLDPRPSLKEKYVLFGGIDIIHNASAMIHPENLPGNISTLGKFRALENLMKIIGKPQILAEKYLDMALEDIEKDFMEAIENVFSGSESNLDLKTYQDFEGIQDSMKFYFEKTNGLELRDSDYLSAEICGIQKGHMYLLGMASGGGKSFLMNRWILPSVIENKKSICMIINEEDHKRIHLELIVYYANIKLKKHLDKKAIQKGKFGEDIWEIINLASEELKKDLNKTLYILPLESYNVDKAITQIKKYASLGVDYFVLDTLKLGDDVNSKDQTWMSLQADTVKLYNLIKPANKNLCLFATVQLGKQSLNQKYLNNSSIGISKNMVDVMDCCLLSRLLYPDEKAGKNFTCFRITNKSETRVDLDPDKNYLIIFITKNRFGNANALQIVAEIDFNTSYYKEIGYARIAPEI